METTKVQELVRQYLTKLNQEKDKYKHINVYFSYQVFDALTTVLSDSPALPFFSNVTLHTHPFSDPNTVLVVPSRGNRFKLVLKKENEDD